MTTSVLPRPEVAPPGPWFFPKAQRFSLANGLQLLAYDLPGKLVAAVRLALDLPLSTEPQGSEGIGSIAVNALDEGTASHDAQGFASARNRLGASYTTSVDATGATLSLDLPVSRLAAGLDLLAEATTTPTFPAVEVDRLIKQQLDGIANQLANPGARAAIEAAKAYYAAGSRRAIPTSGTTDSVAQLHRDAVEAYYLSRINPATSTLIVAGDLTGVDVLALAEASFGTWAAGPAVPSSQAVDDVVAGPRVVVIDRPGSVQTQLLLAVPGLGRAHEDLQALQVAAYALGGGMESRLMQVLREEKGYTYGVSAQVAPERNDGRLVSGGAFQTEVTGAAVEDLLGILRGFDARGVTQAERDAAVEQMAGKAPVSYERPQAVAQTAAMLVANGLPDDHIDRVRAKLRDTTPEDADAAFAKHVDLSRSVVVAVGDAAVIAEPLGKAGLGEVTVVPA